MEPKVEYFHSLDKPQILAVKLTDRCSLRKSNRARGTHFGSLSQLGSLRSVNKKRQQSRRGSLVPFGRHQRPRGFRADAAAAEHCSGRWRPWRPAERPVRHNQR